TRVLVIDKHPAPAASEQTGQAASPSDLLDLLGPVRVLRRHTTPQGAPAQSVSIQLRTGKGGGDRVPVRRMASPAPTLDAHGEREEEEAEPLEVQPARPHAEHEELTARVFDAYRAHVVVTGARPHPTPLVESSAMAAARPPQCSYR